MINFFYKYKTSILFIFVWIFLSIVFLHGYNRYPYEGHGEEQAFAWAGFSYLKSGVPTSWSHFDYPKESLVFDGKIGKSDNLKIGVKLVRPWFDHPPLFSVLSGLGPYFAGFSEIEVFPNSLIRIPSVVAFVLTLPVLYLLAKKMSGWKIGILSMLFFGLTPSYVFGGRLAVPEVFFALFYILMLLLWKKFEDSGKYWLTFFVGVLAGIAGIMKITGFLLLPLFMFFALSKKNFRVVIILLLTQIPFIVYLYWYAQSLDIEVFLQILNRQGFRPVGWTSLPFIFSSPGYDISFSYDGWYVLGIVSTIALLVKKIKNLKILKWGIFYWFCVLIFTAGQQDMLPWYRFTIYPLISISLALFVSDIYKNPGFPGVVLVVGMLLSSKHYLSNAFRPDVLPKVFRTEFIFLMLPALIYELNLFNKNFWKNITRLVVIFVIASGLYLNARHIYSAYDIRCESVDCPIGPGNKFSEVRLPYFWRFLILK